MSALHEFIASFATSICQRGVSCVAVTGGELPPPGSIAVRLRSAAATMCSSPFSYFSVAYTQPMSPSCLKIWTAAGVAVVNGSASALPARRRPTRR